MARERELDPIGEMLPFSDHWCMSWGTTISFRWDMWVEATVSCTHGKFKGVSQFFNMTEALENAVLNFNKGEHYSYCWEEYGPKDDWKECNRPKEHDGDHAGDVEG